MKAFYRSRKIREGRRISSLKRNHCPSEEGQSCCCEGATEGGKFSLVRFCKRSGGMKAGDELMAPQSA